MKKNMLLLTVFLMLLSCRSEETGNDTNPADNGSSGTVSVPEKLISKITGSHGEYTKFFYSNGKISGLEISSYNPDSQEITVQKVTCEYQNGKISKTYKNNVLFAQLFYDSADRLTSIIYPDFNLNKNVRFTYRNNLLESIVYPDYTDYNIYFVYKPNEIQFYSNWSKQGEVEYDSKKNPLSGVDKNLIYSLYLCDPYANPENVNFTNNIKTFHLYYKNSNFNFVYDFAYEYDQDGYATKRTGSWGTLTYEYQ
ncbi:hypothetical protein [Kaistella sp.]|uniref:hypothetical protein n=1 Tax=Kaistella sp. TaxID=2782235 RepID=UPI002F94EEE7